LLVVLILHLAPGAAAVDNNRDALSLWYRQPAGRWTEAVPVGNGRLAAMVFGDLRRERIQLNEDTVWSGEKRDRSNPDGQKAVPEIRRLLQEGPPAEAQRLADRAMISVPRALPVYQTLGDLWLEFSGEGDATDYRRDLDLNTGVASVRESVRTGGHGNARGCALSADLLL
jgi:alpha-L-fucosidase 2